MDKVAEEVEKVKKAFQDTYDQTLKHIESIQEYGKTSRISNQREIEEAEKKDSLPRLNGLAQDGLNMLQSLQFNLDLLAPQLPSADDIEKAQSLAQSWKNQIMSLRQSLRNANLQAKANMKKAAQQERELLLGGGEESTARRLNLQTKAGMTSAAESITESLRRTRQLMVQEVERSASTIMTFEESTGVLKKAESEYKGHRSLFSRTRGLLSTMQRQDVLDRLILITGFLIFSLAVLYVVSKRIGILKLQRKVVAAVKAGMAGQEEIAAIGGRDGVNVAPVHQNMVPDLNVPLEQPMHDEL
ncbi:Sec20 family protein [Perilla frutescens var. hirtella]|uniref:Sec20 family protein n=1 Tax=Perilla frutescens var. hirtella TaxID=608512 RepID=A0AAD4ISX9_PERFH|nr:Sec20 family protein [Perilla frutescens var. hirtella]KAH6820934.1 Sec20 family protein [Perilla frutescens var. hirtella]